ncbi:MAG: oxidoreductase [Candidatus Kapabacteria bacterium]|jgi:uncharacterized protein YbjT (DUF2867 family)|nr:oxidoreductase [Candidatus Kapabacteria bacterium]
MSNQRTALLVGASGLVGGHLLQALLADDAYSRVTVLVRKPLSTSHPKLVQETVDFARLSDAAGKISAQDVFCTLGTTIGKAGSQEAFRKVDFEYPLRTAEMALLRGAEQYLIVTAIGSDSRSPIFYSRTKGEVEEAIAALGYKTFVAFRPSFLAGERTESRLGETLGIAFGKLLGFAMIGPMAKYRVIDAEVVAKAMLLEAKRNAPGKRLIDSDEIQRIYDAAFRTV